MKASILDLRRRMGEVQRALDRGEAVTLLRRGKVIGVIQPAGAAPSAKPVAEHEAFGIWKDRPDFRDVGGAMDKLRKGRFHAL
jgi:antitoxin (DNA-binding transcriptional repressor) of toxin-antitoxin stability system